MWTWITWSGGSLGYYPNFILHLTLSSSHLKDQGIMFISKTIKHPPEWLGVVLHGRLICFLPFLFNLFISAKAQEWWAIQPNTIHHGPWSTVRCLLCHFASPSQRGLLLMLLEHSHILRHCRPFIWHVHCPSPRTSHFPTDPGCFYWRTASKVKEPVPCRVILPLSPQLMKYRNTCMHNSPCALTCP